MSCGYDEEASTCRPRGRKIPRPEKHHAPHTVERDILRICTRSACMTPTLATRVVHVAVRLCAVSSLVRHVSVMASETLVRTGTRGRPVVLEAAMRGGKRSGGSWQVVGVHSADITGASALHAEEEPQHSNDFRWVLWRQARSCQHCGHRAAQERVRGSWWHSPEPPPQVHPRPLPPA